MALGCARKVYSYRGEGIPKPALTIKAWMIEASSGWLVATGDAAAATELYGKRGE